MALFTVEQVKSRIKSLSRMSDLELEDFCDTDGLADSLVQDRQFRERLKPTQLRKVFHPLKEVYREVEREVNKDKEVAVTPFDRNQIVRLMPSLAYASGRDLIPMDFYELVTMCLSKDRLQTKGDLLTSVKFLEAILAYHKFRS